MDRDDEQRPGTDTAKRRRWVQRRGTGGADRWQRGMFRGTMTATMHAPGWDQRHWTSRLLHRVGDVVADSGAGIVATCLVAVWAVVGVFSDFPVWWQTVLYSTTSSVTFVMVFVIQHTQARQTSATQRKLDELLRATAGADDALIAVEEAPDEILQALADLNLDDRQRATDDQL